VFNVRADNGHRILHWSHIRKIVAGRIFIAIAAALAAAGFTFATIRYAEKGNAEAPSDPSRSAAPSATPATTDPTSVPPPPASPGSERPSTCTTTGLPGVAKATPDTAGNLVFCPVQINHGKLPITGPFNLTGQIIGPQPDREDLILLVRIDPATCDAKGRRGAPGRFLLNVDLRARADGTWSHDDDLGGQADGVTLGRIFEFAKAPAAAVQALKASRPEWNDTGITDLPKEITILASFEVPPGQATRSAACTD